MQFLLQITSFLLIVSFFHLELHFVIGVTAGMNSTAWRPIQTTDSCVVLNSVVNVVESCRAGPTGGMHASFVADHDISPDGFSFLHHQQNCIL
jgi:hypothetical protein